MTPRVATEVPEPLDGEAAAAPAEPPDPEAERTFAEPWTAARVALAVGLGLAALVLFRIPIPLIAPEVPFRLAIVPLLAAFVLLGQRLGWIAAAVSLAGSWGSPLVADALHVAAAWSAVRLRPRLRTVVVGAILFWCSAGALVDLLVVGPLLGTTAEGLVLVFAGQLYSDAVGAFLAEGLLRAVPRAWRRPRAEQRTELRWHFSWWATWLVVAPALVLALVFARITFREQQRRAGARSQAVAVLAATAISDALDAEGRALEGMAAAVEFSLPTYVADARALDALRGSHPRFARLTLRDRSGQVVASSPPFGTSAARPGTPSRSRYALALERAAEGDTPALLTFSVPLDAGAAGSLAAVVEGEFLEDVLAERLAEPGTSLAVKSDDGALVAEAARDPGGRRTAAVEQREVTVQAVPWLRWGVWLDEPLAAVQHEGRRALARITASFLIMVALLQLATWVLARTVAVPLARIDRAAGALEAGGVGGVVLLDDLRMHPIAEVHGLAARFTRMHEALAYHDALTGLPNEKLVLDRLSVAVAQAEDPPRSFTVLLVDLDRFRVIDSTLGHTLANEVLRKVGRRLQECVRVGDTVARVGGDEFALLLPRIGRMEEATDVALKVMDAIKRPFLVAGQDVFVTASVGIGLYPRDGADPETLLKNAVAAAYVAKEQGQDSYRRYTARIKVRDAQRLLVETGLRRALETGGLFLHYQPIVDLATGGIQSAEALVRWRREDVGVVDAGTFIPIAEASGLITAIDQWVLRAACAQAAAWAAAGRQMRIAVNLSGRQVQEADVVDQIRHALDRASLDPRLLEIEITEGVALRDVDHCAEVLEQLRRLGLTISVDDFGTGYSSLSFLRRLSVDRVKLDRSFVQDITHNAGDAAIATAVIAMSHGLKLNVVAEGVETEEQLGFLRQHGCDSMQGYLFSPPVPAEEFEALVAAGRRLAVS